jgi:hypothetical protein
VNFIDRILVRLADPATRGGLFSEDALADLAEAAYDTTGMQVQGPFQAVFDEVTLGLAPRASGMIEGTWRSMGGMDVAEVRLTTLGLGPAPAAARLDALWRGSIVARSVPTDSQITSVSVEWPDIESIDAEIIADLGSLPANPQTLEQERRQRFLTRVRDVLDQPDAFTEAVLDPWLSRVGASSVGDLLTRYRGVVHPAGVRVAFSEPSAAPPSPVPLPVTVALLIRDLPFSITNLIADSKLVREQLASQAVERPHEPSLRPRPSPLVAALVPDTVFDDEDWPGATAAMNAAARRAARRGAANQWLSREGIALVPVAS